MRLRAGSRHASQPSAHHWALILAGGVGQRLRPLSTPERPKPKMKHCMSAVKDCEVLEVSTPFPDDVVRVEDAYGRVGTSGG